MPPHRTSPTSPYKGQGSFYHRPALLNPTSPSTGPSSSSSIAGHGFASGIGPESGPGPGPASGLGASPGAGPAPAPSMGASPPLFRPLERSSAGSLYTDVRPSYPPTNPHFAHGHPPTSRPSLPVPRQYSQPPHPPPPQPQPQQPSGHFQAHHPYHQAPHQHQHHQFHQHQHQQPQHQQQQQQHHHHHHHQPLYSPISVPTTSSSPNSHGTGSKAQAIDAGHARAYRSRKDRPCDSCRKRKSRCVIIEAGQNCQSCRLNGRSCTFDMDPTPRSRPPKPDDANQSHSHQSKSPSASVGGGLARFGSRDRKASSASSSLGMMQEGKSPTPVKHASGPSHPAASRRSNTDDLHGFISRMMTGGEDAYPEDRSESHNGDGDRVPQEEKGMMPVVLGSSSSEDPFLLKQAETRATPSTANTPSVPGAHRHSSGAKDQGSSGASSGGGNNRSTSNVENNSTAVATTTVPSDAEKPPVPPPLQIRQMTRDPLHPIFFAFVPSHPYGRLQNQAKEIGADGLLKLRRSLGDKVAPLMVLYSLRDSAAFPLLMESQRNEYREATIHAMASYREGEFSASAPLESETAKDQKASGRKGREGASDEAGQAEDLPLIPLPPVLATSTLATATVYDASLRPISKQAWGYNLHALKEQFDISTLVTLQVALTDLTGRPSINTSGNFMTFNQTLAIAHMLGLHLDPTSWRVSKEERDVRIRLWWAIVIHDKWSALCWGRPSVIHSSHHSVPLPKRNSLSPCADHLADAGLSAFQDTLGWERNSDLPSDAHTPGDTFAGLCRLTLTLNDVLTNFHSVVPIQELRRDGFVVAQRVKFFMAELEDWKDSMPATLRAVLRGDEVGAKSTEAIPGTRSLQLSYLGVNQLVCRTAMDAFTAMGDDKRMLPAFEAGLSSAVMVVDFLESLTDEDYRGGFFLHYGAHHLAGSLSLLCRLCLTFSRLDNRELLASSITTLSRLLVALSDAHRLHKWDLAELALTRSRGMLPTLEAMIPGFPRFMASTQESTSIRQPSHRRKASWESRTQDGVQQSQQPKEEEIIASAVGDTVMAEAGSSTTSVSTSTSNSTSASWDVQQGHAPNDPSGPRQSWQGEHSSQARPHDGQQHQLYEQQHAPPLPPQQQEQQYPPHGAPPSDVAHLFDPTGGVAGHHAPTAHAQVELDQTQQAAQLQPIQQLSQQQQQEVTIDAMGLPYNMGMTGGHGGQSSSHLLPSLEADWLSVMHMGNFPEWPVNVNV